VDGWFSAAISVATLVLFAYLASFYPEYLWIFFVLSLAAVFAISLLAGGRSVSKLLKDMEYVRGGRTLLAVGREVVEKLMGRDKQLQEELRGQTLALVYQVVPLLAFLAIFLVPGLRESFAGLIAGPLSALNLPANLGVFLSTLALYGTAMLALQLASYYARRKVERAGGRLEVPRFYLVTDRGLLLEGRVPLRAPLSITELSVNTRRRFVEFKAKGPAGTVRYRLYYDDPRELESYLAQLSKERS